MESSELGGRELGWTKWKARRTERGPKVRMKLTYRVLRPDVRLSTGNEKWKRAEY
jgi:hypothetical protein